MVALVTKASPTTTARRRRPLMMTYQEVPDAGVLRKVRTVAVLVLVVLLLDSTVTLLHVDGFVMGTRKNQRNPAKTEVWMTSETAKETATPQKKKNLLGPSTSENQQLLPWWESLPSGETGGATKPLPPERRGNGADVPMRSSIMTHSSNKPDGDDEADTKSSETQRRHGGPLPTTAVEKRGSIVTSSSCRSNTQTNNKPWWEDQHDPTRPCERLQAQRRRRHARWLVTPPDNEDLQPRAPDGTPISSYQRIQGG